MTKKSTAKSTAAVMEIIPNSALNIAAVALDPSGNGVMLVMTDGRILAGALHPVAIGTHAHG